MAGRALQSHMDNFDSPDSIPMEVVPSPEGRRNSAQARKAAMAARDSGRRRFVDPTTCERDYAAAELEFMMAMDEYKKRSGRMFPTWSEVLEVLKGLGYEKASGPADLPG